jgi:hypothetical protein
MTDEIENIKEEIKDCQESKEISRCEYCVDEYYSCLIRLKYQALQINLKGK